MAQIIDRYEIGWRIWCWLQGYGEAEDREIMTNWFRDDENTLHPQDIEQRRQILEIADEVIALAESGIKGE